MPQGGRGAQFFAVQSHGVISSTWSWLLHGPVSHRYHTRPSSGGGAPAALVYAAVLKKALDKALQGPGPGGGVAWSPTVVQRPCAEAFTPPPPPNPPSPLQPAQPSSIADMPPSRCG